MRTPRPFSLPQRPATRSQLLAEGATKAMIETQLRVGGLRRLRQGVYLDATAWPQDGRAQHLIAAHAEQVLRPEAVMSHRTAAVVWGLPTPGFESWHQGPVTLTVPETTRHAIPGIVVHRTAGLPPPLLTRDEEGYAVTTIARTAVDLAQGYELPGALVLLDAAARRLVESFVATPRRSDYANPRFVDASRSRLTEAVGCRVGPSLRHALSVADPGRETAIESLSFGHMVLAEIPLPEIQPRIVTSRGTFYPDFLWRAASLIDEADGAVKYQGPQAMLGEKEREQSLRDLGFRFVRWLGKEILLQPATVMARIERALER